MFVRMFRDMRLRADGKTKSSWSERIYQWQYLENKDHDTLLWLCQAQAARAATGGARVDDEKVEE